MLTISPFKSKLQTAEDGKNQPKSLVTNCGCLTLYGISLAASQAAVIRPLGHLPSRRFRSVVQAKFMDLLLCPPANHLQKLLELRETVAHVLHYPDYPVRPAS